MASECSDSEIQAEPSFQRAFAAVTTDSSPGPTGSGSNMISEHLLLQVLDNPCLPQCENLKLSLVRVQRHQILRSHAPILQLSPHTLRLESFVSYV